MIDLVVFIAVLVGWLVLNRLVLPKMGIHT